MRIWNYIAISFRTLFFHRGFSLLTLVGLSIGIAMSIFVLEYVLYQFSFDSHYDDATHIYRVISKGKMENEDVNIALSPLVLASRLKEYPEVSSITRVLDSNPKPVESFYAKTFESKIIYGDSSFFSIFSRPFLLGSADQWRSDSLGVVLSQSVASELFVNQNPLGKPIWINETDTFWVRGVFQDVPENSHFTYGIVLPFAVIEKQLKAFYGIKHYNEVNQSWFSLMTFVYCKIRPGTDVQQLEESFNTDIESELESQRQALFASSSQTFLNFSFQNLVSIYLFSKCDYEIGKTTNPLYVFIFLGIALFILLVTAFNVMNLTTSRASDRIREAIVRRFFGAKRRNLVIQFISESVLFSFMALFLGLVLVEWLLPFFGNLFGVDFLGMANRGKINFTLLLLITLFVGVLSGIYPATVFSGVKPVQFNAAQTRFSSYPGLLFRGFLVFGQVFLAVLLCTISLGMWRQMDYIENYDLGFDTNNLMLVEGIRFLGEEDVDKVMDKIKRIEGISAVSKIYVNPGDPVQIMSFNLAADSNQTYFLSVYYVDCTVFNTIGSEIKKGTVSCQDSSWVLINEECASLLGIDDIEGQYLQTDFPGSEGVVNFQIGGVVSNIYWESLKNSLRPAIYIPVRHQSHGLPRSFAVRYSGVDFDFVYQEIKNIWDEVETRASFTAQPISEKINTFYSEDYRYSMLSTAFAILIVIIGALGMTGLVSFIISTQREDLLMRKLFGYSDMRNVFSLFWGYLGFVVSGIILALIFSVTILNFWLRTFSIHTSVDSFCFLLPAFLLAGLALGIAFYGVARLRKQLSLHQF